MLIPTSDEWIVSTVFTKLICGGPCRLSLHYSDDCSYTMYTCVVMLMITYAESHCKVLFMYNVTTSCYCCFTWGFS